jgi:hypothetical protein
MLEVIEPGNVTSVSARDVMEALSRRAIVNLRLGRLWLQSKDLSSPLDWAHDEGSVVASSSKWG